MLLLTEVGATIPAGEVIAELAVKLAGQSRQFAGINAAEPHATAFAAEWHRLSGAGSNVHRRTRLFRLGLLTSPSPLPPGALRLAAEADSDLVERWFGQFAAEAEKGMGGPTRAAIADRISHGGVTLWETAGEAVSMAGVTRQVAGVVRVGPVFTPPDQRRRGYAGAVTAEVSQAALDTGAADVVLFTDLANPTSNALYQRLGYRPVEDRVVLAFGD